METPSSSTRRVTRSQALAASANNSSLLLSGKVEETTAAKSWQRTSKKQQQDRSPLIDITNDSPIVGIAMGNFETPSSAVSKKRLGGQGQVARTPGSGEALLRCQVKALLEKVEEEAEMSRITIQDRPFFRHLSPMNLIAPTPANTPQVVNLSAECCQDLPPAAIEKFPIPPMFNEEKEEEFVADNLITRSLMVDFSEKLEGSDSSKCSSMIHRERAALTDDDDDDSSIWSIQVNASSTMDDFEEEEDGDCDELINGLCEGISKISVGGGLKFTGKHTRFVYNSDDELLRGEEEVKCESPALHLKGLPTPKGKHLRFPEEESE